MPTKTLKSKSTKPKAKARTGKTTTRRAASPRRESTRVAPARRREETTYIYECTRPGCGYRIVRDENADQGQLRFDLKCPKCHHQEFRCLGKGDLPEEFNSVPTVQIDFGAFKSIGLGAN